MKKAGTIVLLCLTLAFVSFLTGFFVGRSMHSKPVTVQTDPSKDSETTTSEATDAAVATADKININTASEQLLDTLPGIGPVLAKRIVEYRQANGPFEQITDIAQVEGIGSEKLLLILDLITVEE